MELQQSSLYARYVSELGWQVEKLGSVNIFIKHIPFLGGFAKIQRPNSLPDPKHLIYLLKIHHIKTIAVEPTHLQNQEEFTRWLTHLKSYFKINTSPFIPSKTIVIDINISEEDIFKRFSEAKRRAVRRAIKNNLQICESANIQNLIRIKNKSSGLLGFITTFGIDKLWKFFAPKHASVLLAYAPSDMSHAACLSQDFPRDRMSQLLGGVLLVFCQRTAYYWIAGAMKKGKKLFAPTLLVWEALKLAKKRKCTVFDFVGVYDERLPKYSKDWKGFTKFKEGFGGNSLYYPLAKTL